MADNKESNKPVAKFRARGVSVAVWKQEGEKQKDYTPVFFSVTPQKAFKDKKGEWQNSSSFNEGDIPLLQLCLDQAFAWINTEGRKKDDD